MSVSVSVCVGALFVPSEMFAELTSDHTGSVPPLTPVLFASAVISELFVSVQVMLKVPDPEQSPARKSPARVISPGVENDQFAASITKIVFSVKPS